MKEFFDYLAKHNVSPNGYYVLHCMFHEYSHVSYINTRSEQYRLSMSGFVKDEGNDVYTITTLGGNIIRQCEKILEKNITKQKKVPFEEWAADINAYNDLFPKGRRSDSSIAFRANPKELYERFAWFFNEFPNYNWDLVKQATVQYINSFKESGEFTYMQNAKYFIKKDDKNKQTTSNLATICWQILEGNDAEIDKEGFHYFGP